MSVPAGAKRLGPGIYELGDELHVDLEELVKENGGDPQDEEALLSAARQVEQWGAEHGIPIEVRLK